jgi:hypothetical protein
MLGERGWSISASMMVLKPITAACVFEGASGVDGYSHYSTLEEVACRTSATDPDVTHCSTTTTFDFSGPRNMLQVSLYPDKQFVQFSASSLGAPMDMEDEVILNAIDQMVRGILASCPIVPVGSEIRFFCSDIDAPCPGEKAAIPLTYF